MYYQNTVENIMMRAKDYAFWFCTGSQDLYGEESGS